jgi:hypothetical protein
MMRGVAYRDVVLIVVVVVDYKGVKGGRTMETCVEVFEEVSTFFDRLIRQVHFVGLCESFQRSML